MIQTPLLGAHMSIAGGLFRALERGQSIECNTIQLFTKNSSQWAAKDLSTADIAEFKKTRKKTGMHPVFAHCSYLINLAAPGEFYEKSIDALTIEVLRAERLGLDFVVLHPGAHRGRGETEGLLLVADALNRVLERTKRAKCKIAIENTAGQGSCIGCSMDHFEFLLNHVSRASRLGFCVDTCHLFAAGYDLRTEVAYNNTFRIIADHIPFSKIFAFHLNDSKKPLNSRVDRHAHIGKGEIGAEAFRCLLNDSRFKSVPKVLETPKGKDLAEDVMNLNLLRGLINI